MLVRVWKAFTNFRVTGAQLLRLPAITGRAAAEPRTESRPAGQLACASPNQPQSSADELTPLHHYGRLN
jgi:hypothetical protein